MRRRPEEGCRRRTLPRFLWNMLWSSFPLLCGLPAREYECLSAREHGDVALFLDVEAENFLCQMREIADVARRERAVDRKPRDCGIADDDLFAVVAIEFGGCVGERCMVKHQHALAPAELVGQILNRLLRFEDRTGGRHDHIARQKNGGL